MKFLNVPSGRTELAKAKSALGETHLPLRVQDCSSLVAAAQKRSGFQVLPLFPALLSRTIDVLEPVAPTHG